MTVDVEDNERLDGSLDSLLEISSLLKRSIEFRLAQFCLVRFH